MLPAPWVKTLHTKLLFFSLVNLNALSLTSTSLISPQLKYHETGKEKDCLPQVGQWNMMNKVLFLLFSFFGCYNKQIISLPTYFYVALFMH